MRKLLGIRATGLAKKSRKADKSQHYVQNYRTLLFKSLNSSFICFRFALQIPKITFQFFSQILRDTSSIQVQLFWSEWEIGGGSIVCERWIQCKAFKQSCFTCICDEANALSLNVKWNFSAHLALNVSDAFVKLITFKGRKNDGNWLKLEHTGLLPTLGFSLLLKTQRNTVLFPATGGPVLSATQKPENKTK